MRYIQYMSLGQLTPKICIFHENAIYALLMNGGWKIKIGRSKMQWFNWQIWKACHSQKTITLTYHSNEIIQESPPSAPLGGFWPCFFWWSFWSSFPFLTAWTSYVDVKKTCQKSMIPPRTSIFINGEFWAAVNPLWGFCLLILFLTLIAKNADHSWQEHKVLMPIDT